MNSRRHGPLAGYLRTKIGPNVLHSTKSFKLACFGTRVIDTTPIAPASSCWDKQQVMCEVIEILKGTLTNSVTFQQGYPKRGKPNEGCPQGLQDTKILNSDHVLVFIAKRLDAVDGEVAFWTNLSRPEIGPWGRNVAYNNDCKRLTDEKSILGAVRARIAREKTVGSKRRGVIVDFSAFEHDLHWDFIRTADPECKQQFVKSLGSSYADSRAASIFNLVSYPGAETLLE